MGVLLANNVSTTLASGITTSGSTLYVDDASLMPTPGAGEWFWLTLTQASEESSWEVVKCTGRSGNTLTVVRGQDGSSFAAWPAGTVVSMRGNAQLLRDLSGGILGQLQGPEIVIGGTGSVALRGAYAAAASSVGSVDVVAGDIILVYWCSNNTLSSPTCSDGVDTYTQKGTGQYVAEAGVQSHVYWARASANGTRTVTVSDGGASSPTIHVQVISGIVASGDPFDSLASFTTTSPGGNTATTNSITPTSDGAFISAFFAEDVTSATTYGVGSSGFTLASSQNATDCFSNSFYKVQPAAAVISMTASINKVTYSATCILALKAAAAAAATSTIGRMHVCAGTTANYAVALPAVAGNAGRFIGFRMDPGLTKLVTLDGNASETIDGALTRIMWASEVAILFCDGTSWFKFSGNSIPMHSVLGVTSNQTFTASNATKLNYTTSLLMSAPAAFQDSANAKVTALRPGKYAVSVTMITNNTNTSAGQNYLYIYKNGAGGQLSAMFYVPASANMGLQARGTLVLAVGDYLQPYGNYLSGSYTTSFYYNDSALPGYNKFEVLEISPW